MSDQIILVKISQLLFSPTCEAKRFIEDKSVESIVHSQDGRQRTALKEASASINFF